MDNRFTEYDKYLIDDDGNEGIPISKPKASTQQKEAHEPLMSIEREPQKRPAKKAPQKAESVKERKPKKAPKKPTGKKDNLKKALIVLCAITGIFELLTFILLIKVNMLPAKFLILAGIGFALLLFIICGLMFMKSKHRFGKRKIAATILAALTIISCVIGIIIMCKLIGTLGSVISGKKLSADKLDDPYIMYISGSDTRDNELSEKTRSDVNILAVINPKTHQVLLLNTPRDYYVRNPAYTNGMDKLTHCGLNGIENSMAALCELYELKEIEYNCRINFTGFEKLVDSVGGIDIYSEYEFTTEDGSNVHISKGMNHLNGAEALAYARERHAFASGDLQRGQNQMTVIKAIADKMMSSKTLVSNYMGLMNSLKGMFETDAPQNLISYAVKDMLGSGESWDIQSYAVTGKASYAVCCTSGQSLSVIIRDEDSVTQAKEYIRQVVDGEALVIE